jgi:hypothetical protein
MVASTCGTIIAAAPPCAARATISIDADPDSPHHGEADDAGKEDALAPDNVTQSAAGYHQCCVGDLIDGNDRLDLGRIRVQVGADRRHRDIHDEGIEHGKELRRGHARQCPPATGGHGDGLRERLHLGTSFDCGAHPGVPSNADRLRAG